MIKKLLVATDFSAGAENATRYAAAAAASQGFELVLFTLYNVSVHALNARSSVETLNQMLERYQKKLDTLAAKLQEELAIRVHTHVASGDFEEEIQGCFVEHKADMIVMGMARKSLEQDLLGNTTTGVIHSLKLPVVAIPQNAVFLGIKKILFACDLTRGVQGRVLSAVGEVAKGFGASVEVFSVRKKIADLAEPIAEHLETIRQQLDGVDHFYKDTVAEGVIEAIKHEVEANQIDLVIMVPHKYGFWNSLVHRSKTRIMASGSDVPLLSLPL